MKKNAGKRIILCIVAFLTLLPLTYVFIVSCESKSTYYQKIVSISFTDFSFENYITMAQNIEIWIKIINTFLITVCVVVFTLLLAVPFAYIITKTDRKRRLLIMLILLAFSFMPEQVTILSKYKMFLGIGLTDSVIAVVLLLVSQQLSFTSLMLQYLFSGIPQSLYWAAELDGCTEAKEIIYVTVPLAKSGIVVQSILGAVASWNNLLIPMVFLRSENLKTIMPAIAAFDRRYGTNVPLQMAGLVIASIPILILYGVFHKKIIDQIDMGTY